MVSAVAMAIPGQYCIDPMTGVLRNGFWLGRDAGLKLPTRMRIVASTPRRVAGSAHDSRTSRASRRSLPSTDLVV